MGRLIDADNFKKEVAAVSIINNIAPEKANALCEIIDRQPTVDAVDAEPVRHGKWIKTHTWNGFTRTDRYTCSLCGYNTERLVKTNFCPECGARMGGEENDGAEQD